MKFKLRHIGGSGNIPAKIIEVTVYVGGQDLTGEITNMKGEVDENLIAELRQIADELEEHNSELNKREVKK